MLLLAKEPSVSIKDPRYPPLMDSCVFDSVTILDKIYNFNACMINISQQVAMLPDLVDRINDLANNIKFCIQHGSLSLLFFIFVVKTSGYW